MCVEDGGDEDEDEEDEFDLHGKQTESTFPSAIYEIFMPFLG